MTTRRTVLSILGIGGIAAADFGAALKEGPAAERIRRLVSLRVRQRQVSQSASRNGGVGAVVAEGAVQKNQLCRVAVYVAVNRLKCSFGRCDQQSEDQGRNDDKDVRNLGDSHNSVGVAVPFRQPRVQVHAQQRDGAEKDERDYGD